MAKKGHRAWNKGLTKETDDRVASYGKSVSESWKEERRQQHKIDSGNRLRIARNKYIEEHPEHQSEASRSIDKEVRMNALRMAQIESRKPEVRAKAKKTFSKRYKNGDFTCGFQKGEMPQEVKDKIRDRLLEREPIYQDTSIELKIQKFLSERGIAFEKQYPFSITFIDVAIPDKKIAIYADGCYWHGCPVCNKSKRIKQLNHDKTITAYLEKSGWKVIRFWEHEINTETFNKLLNDRLVEAGLNG